MIKTNKITYKVFFFERVKKKVRFFDTETYPLQIRLTAGARTLYLKSNFFNQLQQDKYQLEIIYNEAKITIHDIINFEETILKHIIDRNAANISLDIIRQDYGLLSRDILTELDERFKKFLVDFFYTENLPAYSMLIKNAGGNHTSEFILENLKKSLQLTVFEKLLTTAVENAPPYIPFIQFFRESINNPIPLFPVYQWQQETVPRNFNQFIENHFPEYKNVHPVTYINAMV